MIIEQHPLSKVFEVCALPAPPPNLEDIDHIKLCHTWHGLIHLQGAEFSGEDQKILSQARTIINAKLNLMDQNYGRNLSGLIHNT